MPRWGMTQWAWDNGALGPRSGTSLHKGEALGDKVDDTIGMAQRMATNSVPHDRPRYTRPLAESGVRRGARVHLCEDDAEGVAVDRPVMGFVRGYVREALGRHVDRRAEAGSAHGRRHLVFVGAADAEVANLHLRCWDGSACVCSGAS